METDKKEKILDLFFNKHLKQIDIAQILDVSKQYVSKILKADSRYAEAKQNKLKENAIKRKEYLQEYYKTYQSPKNEDAFAKWNLSAYRRNKKGNLVLNKDLKVGFDVPRIVNMNIKIPTQKYKNRCLYSY